MKSIKVLIYLFVFSMMVSCSETNKKSKDLAKTSENKEEQEEVKKNRPITFFPIVVAGSISLIQKIYLKKGE